MRKNSIQATQNHNNIVHINEKNSYRATNSHINRENSHKATKSHINIIHTNGKKLYHAFYT